MYRVTKEHYKWSVITFRMHFKAMTGVYGPSIICWCFLPAFYNNISLQNSILKVFYMNCDLLSTMILSVSTS